MMPTYLVWILALHLVGSPKPPLVLGYYVTREQCVEKATELTIATRVNIPSLNVWHSCDAVEIK